MLCGRVFVCLHPATYAIMVFSRCDQGLMARRKGRFRVAKEARLRREKIVIARGKGGKGGKNNVLFLYYIDY